MKKKPSLYTSLTLTLCIIGLSFSGLSTAGSYPIKPHPTQYIIEKFNSHDVVLLGVYHKEQTSQKFLSDLIVHLTKAGVTHLGLEVCSDQQENIDRFFETGSGLANIGLHPQIDCPEYKSMFDHMKINGQEKRPSVIALDLPLSMYKGEISRDEWMARVIAKTLRLNPNSKMLVVVGNLHVLKRIDWEAGVIRRHGSIRSYLNELIPNRSIFSIVQCIDQSQDKCDFTREFSSLEGVVALDCDERFAGWKIGLMSPVAAKYTAVWELFDGILIY
ncbi:MAG: hypothetical protein SWO11_13515 [Thermodesulfobacteriota bacterium]|nr:hypothetical protein [Thermodesulfobacteriota bacterium]